MLHQHDGISIAPGEEADKEAVIASLKKASVKFAGEEMGIVARLVEAVFHGRLAQHIVLVLL